MAQILVFRAASNESGTHQQLHHQHLGVQQLVLSVSLEYSNLKKACDLRQVND